MAAHVVHLNYHWVLWSYFFSARFLKEAAEDVRYRKRYQLLFGALLSVVGQAVRNEFSKQEDLVKMLAAIAEKVKAAKDKEVGFLDYTWINLAYLIQSACNCCVSLVRFETITCELIMPPI